MKNILIIGDGNSVFVRDFINQYSVRNCQIDLISPTYIKDISGVKSVYTYGSESTNKIFTHINLHFRLFNIIKKLNITYDAIIIHYVNFYLAPHIKPLKNKSKNIIAVVWGSDFYRVNSKIKLKLQHVIYSAVDSIVFTNPKTQKQFIDSNAKIDPKKCHVAGFGLPVLDEIDKLNNMEAEYKDWCEKFSLPADKLKVLVGYNANLAHNQILAIDKIGKIRADLLDSIHLVFPLGYGSKDSKEIILSELSEKGINNFTILGDFYNFEDTAKLRIITDILINIQPSDQFSGSMQETLYAGNTVIAGNWLPYEEIIDNGANIYSIITPDDVGDAITSLVNNPEKMKPKQLKRIKDYISKRSSWRNNLIIWDIIIFKEDSNT